jgi:hypothetical protein
MFIPSEERQREIRDDVRRFHQAWQAAMAYVEAGESETGTALINTLLLHPGKPCPPEEQEWAMHNAIKRAKELDRLEYEKLVKEYPDE